jgi:nucleotide-binding universal stress UspA family protein
VLRHAPCAVLLSRSAKSGKILAATDLSDPTLPALRAGRTEARRLGSELVVLHAAGARYLPFSFEAPGAALYLETGLRRQVETCAARFGAEESRLVDGPPAREIIRAAVDLPARLIVVGAHRRGPFARLLSGSVSGTVIRHAPCDVLAVRMGEAA